MNGPELTAVVARLTATVRVRGPDPSGHVARAASFYVQSQSPSQSDASSETVLTALSATATRLGSYDDRFRPREEEEEEEEEEEDLVAPLSVFLPFLADDRREAIVEGFRGGTGAESSNHDVRAGCPWLAPGTEVHVLRAVGGEGRGDGDGWLPARVVAVTGKEGDVVTPSRKRCPRFRAHSFLVLPPRPR